MRLRGGSRRTFLSLYTSRNYRLYFGGQIASLCGTWMQNIALYWLILDMTGSAVDVGLLSLAQFVPFTVFGLFAGVIADRFDNRKTVIATQAAQMLLSGVLAVTTLLGVIGPLGVYAIGAGLGIAVVFDTPARQTLVGQLVSRPELPNAIGLNSSTGTIARTVGPGLAGIVISVAGTGWCFAINTASFLAVLVGLWAMRPSELFPLLDRGRPSFWRGTREGLAYARRSRPVLVMIGMAAVVVSLTFNVNVLLPVVVKQTLHSGPRTLGAISACFGGGALLGALLSASMTRPRWYRTLGATAAAGLAEIAVAELHTTLAIAALLFVVGFGFSTFSIGSNSVVQLETPDHLRGRVLGLFIYAWNGPVALASPLLGWLCAIGGSRLGFSFSGSCALAATAAGAVALRARPQKTLRTPVVDEDAVQLTL